MTHPATNVGVTCFIVIDGQQRLITTAILLRAFRDFLEGDYETIINSVLKNQVRNIFGNLKIIVSDKDREAYEKIMGGGEFSRSFLQSSNIGKCYLFFKSKLQEVLDNPEDYGNIDLKKLFDTVASKLQVVAINVDEDDPSAIFESVNSKRAELTMLDLLRNYVLMKFSSKSQDDDDDEQKKFYDRHWFPFEKSFKTDVNLNHDVLEDFIRHYLMMSGTRVPSRATYVTTKERINDLISEEKGKWQSEDSEFDEAPVIIKFVDDMTRVAKYYRHIIDHEKFSSNSIKPPNLKKINRSLSNLNKINSKSHSCFVLNLFDSFDRGEMGEDDFVKSIRMVESYVIRRSMVPSGLNANVVDVMFLDLCKNKTFDSESLYAELNRDSGNRIWPNDVTIRDIFREERIYDNNKRLCNLILKSIQHKYNEKEQIMDSEISIEHILPKKPTRAWLEYLGVDEKTCKTYEDLLGNLTLTGYNSELSNKTYEEKKGTYMQSNFTMTRKIANDYNVWGIEQIKERTEKLIEEIIDIWPREKSRF